ncbi:MAG TPA: VWA domain-containing protein, partial [Nitrososphaerales archaeon]|nr:VWA domain-containing protein [Nitrososphaerales archaeon]
FVQRLIAFSEILREEQFGVTSAETLDAAEATMEINVSNLEDFRVALKASLVKRAEDYARFDLLFRKFWLTKPTLNENPLGRISISGKKIERPLQIPDNPVNQTGRGRITAGSMISSLSPNVEDVDKLLGIYSPLETTSRRTFEELNFARDRALLKRGLRSFARATATRPGRRFVASRNGEKIDFRKLFRRNLKTGGHPLELDLRSRKLSKSRLVVLCDISGSMDSYSARVLKLIYHLTNTIRGSQVFGFSTRVVSLNQYLRGKTWREASHLVSDRVDIWSSGTRIGSALGDLLVNHSGVLRPSTVFIVISDGWELGDLATLRARLNEIRRHVAQIVWLNPQADSPDYVPLAEGMKNSLPYIDIFAGLDIFSNRAKFRRSFG